jgi:hypothetical protein
VGLRERRGKKGKLKKWSCVVVNPTAVYLPTPITGRFKPFLSWRPCPAASRAFFLLLRRKGLSEGEHAHQDYIRHHMFPNYIYPLTLPVRYLASTFRKIHDNPRVEKLWNSQIINPIYTLWSTPSNIFQKTRALHHLHHSSLPTVGSWEDTHWRMLKGKKWKKWTPRWGKKELFIMDRSDAPFVTVCQEGGRGREEWRIVRRGRCEVGTQKEVSTLKKEWYMSSPIFLLWNPQDRRRDKGKWMKMEQKRKR